MKKNIAIAVLAAAIMITTAAFCSSAQVPNRGKGDTICNMGAAEGMRVILYSAESGARAYRPGLCFGSDYRAAVR